MQTSIDAAPPAGAPAAAVPAATRRVPTWLREPLLHFLVLGVVLFVVDHFIANRAGDPRVIVVDAAVDAQAMEVFRNARGRAPNAEELYALRRVWLDNEVLYREGIALGLDKGDSAIRERVIFKALSMVDAGVKLPKVEEATLRTWFEKHRAKYDEPARYDFEEAVLTGGSAAAAESVGAAQSFAAALNAGAPGDAEAGLRVFTRRPHANLVDSYGADFAASLGAAPRGEWRAIAARDGTRVVRLTAFSPAAPASFEDLAGVVLQDWTDAVMAERRSAAVGALARKYSVEASEPKP
jgi:hypothetical protein